MVSSNGSGQKTLHIIYTSYSGLLTHAHCRHRCWHTEYPRERKDVRSSTTSGMSSSVYIPSKLSMDIYYYTPRSILHLDFICCCKGSSLALLSTKRPFPFLLYQRILLKHVAVHCRPYTQSWLPRILSVRPGCFWRSFPPYGYLCNKHLHLPWLLWSASLEAVSRQLQYPTPPPGLIHPSVTPTIHGHCYKRLKVLLGCTTVQCCHQ